MTALDPDPPLPDGEPPFPPPWQDGRYGTPYEVLDYLRALPRPYAARIVHRFQERTHEAMRCWELGHVDRVESLQDALRTAIGQRDNLQAVIDLGVDVPAPAHPAIAARDAAAAAFWRALFNLGVALVNRATRTLEPPR